jgi:hypothetical protein
VIRPTASRSIHPERLRVIIVFGIMNILEFVPGSRVVISNPIAAALRGPGIAAFNVIVHWGPRKDCLVTQ